MEKLKTLLAAENYDKYKDFRVRVLEVAVSEINQFTLLKVSYEAKKELGSRAFTHICFTLNKVKNMIKGYKDHKKGIKGKMEV